MEKNERREVAGNKLAELTSSLKHEHGDENEGKDRVTFKNAVLLFTG